MSTTVARLEAILSANTRDFDRAMNRSESKMHKIGKVAGVAGLAVAGGLAVGLEKSIKAAIDSEKAEARLTQAFKNAHLQIGPYTKSIERAEGASRRLGFTDDDTKNALGSLITSTGSYKASLQQLAIAQDLARFKGVGLEQATKALTMAHAGSLRPLKQLGIDISKSTDAVDKLKAETKKHTGVVYENALAQARLQDKTATFQKVLDVTSQKVHGQADAYSKTAAGAMEEFKAQLNHIEIEIGQKLLPVMTNAIIFIRNHWPEISAVIKQVWSTDIKPTLDAMIELIRSVVTVIRNNWGTIGPIVKAFAAVIETNLRIVSAIIRTFAALLRGDWSQAWKEAKQAVDAAIDGIKARIQLALAAGSAILNLMSSLGSALLGAFKAAIVAGEKEVEKAITGLFGKVIGWAEHALGIKSPSTVFYGIGQNAVKGFINGVGSMGGALKKAVVGIAEHAATSLYHGAGHLIHGGKATGSSANRNIGQQLAAAYGWARGSEWASLDALFNQESGWNNHAKNPSSGAYGIAQALPPTKMPFAAQEAGGSNAAAQIAWGLAYIKSRYGDPNAAWGGYWARGGWYDKGGWLMPGATLAMNTTGRPERVVSGNGDNAVFNVHVGGAHLVTIVWDQLRQRAKVFEDRNGRPAFGGA